MQAFGRQEDQGELWYWVSYYLVPVDLGYLTAQMKYIYNNYSYIVFISHLICYTIYGIFLFIRGNRILKILYYVGSSEKDLKKLPEETVDAFVYGLSLAQEGGKSPKGKVLKGFGGADVIELIDRDAAGTYRAVYTVRMPKVVFVLHVFQKKSKHGIATPKQDMDLIKSRLQRAQEIYKESYK